MSDSLDLARRYYESGAANSVREAAELAGIPQRTAARAAKTHGWMSAYERKYKGLPPVEPPEMEPPTATPPPAASMSYEGMSAEEILGDRIRRCQTPEDVMNVVKEAAALVAEAKIRGTQATALKAMFIPLQEAAETYATHQASEKQLLCTEEAVGLVQLFETIVNGKRRAAILAFAASEAAADAKDFPNPVDGHAVNKRLAELGLDAFGEPKS